MAARKLRLLGEFELKSAGGLRLRTRKAEALLAYLALPAGRPHQRDKLAAFFWGDKEDGKARHNLAQTLHLIRKALDIDGDLKGDVEIEGLLTGSITVGGSLNGSGAILVTELTTGEISIGKETTSLTEIHLLGGLGSGGTVEINSSEGAFDAVGDITVGLATCSATPPDVTFDGCIGIRGDLDGAISVCGCHATAADLDICIDGDDNGNVTISQTGCTNQVDWSCPFAGCP